MTKVPGKKWRGRRYPPKKEGVPSLGRKVVLLTTAILLAGAVFAAAGFGLYSWLSRSDFFQITAIKIHGTNRVGKGTVLEWSGIDVHSNLLRMSRKEVEKRLVAHPWIAEVRIRRDWPDCLLISVSERRPIALLYGGDGFFFMDRAGTLFAAVLPGDDLDFPVISGIGWQDWEEAGSSGVRADILQLLHQADKGGANLPLQNISELHVDGPNSLVMFLADRPFPIYLGGGNIEQKFSRVARVLGWLYKKKQFKETTAIRLDDLDKKILVERGGSG